MKNLLLSLGLGLMSLSAMAQTESAAQLPNSDFKTFESDAKNNIGVRPVGWKASNVNQMLKKQLVFDASSTGEGVKMMNDFIGMFGMGANAPAYITLGETWNYVKGMDASTGDGGTYGGIQFSYMPDVVNVSYKRVMGKEKAQEEAKIILYTWKGQTSATSEKWTGEMIDREQDVLGKTAAGVQMTQSEDFALVSNTEYTIKPGTMQNFETVEIPLNYVASDVTPEKMNVILSSADYYTRANIGKGNVLYVNSIKFVYHHELTSIVYDGKTYPAAKDEVLDLSKVAYDASKISFEKKGAGATVVTTFDEPTGLLTVRVLGSDNEVNPESATAYTVQFAKPLTPAPVGEGIVSVKIGGEDFADFKADQTEYTLPYAYHPGIVIEGVASEGYQMVKDGQNAAFYDNAAQTITLKAKNASEQVATYVFHFTAAVEGEEAGDYKGGLLVVLTNAEGEDSNAPLMSNETLIISKNSNGTVNLAINNFSFVGLSVGDIFVSDVPVVDNKISAKKMVRLTSYKEDGTPNTSALGWTLGVLPLQVDVTLHPEAGGKYAEASIDILTGETLLSSMFKNIHVDIVPFEFEASEPIVAEKPWGSVSYYSFIKATGYMTKASAKFLQLTNSYVNEKGVQIDRPMDYIDLTGVSFEKGVKLADVMKGAPKKNNTLVYINKDGRLYGNNVIKNGETSKLALCDSINLVAPMDFVARGTSYNRKFVPGQAETLILPFKVAVSVIDGQVFELGAFENDQFNLVAVTDTVLAGKPYIVYANKEQLFANAGRVEVAANENAEYTTTVGDFKLVGAYKAKECKAGEETYYALQDGAFVKVADTYTMAPFRAVLSTTQAALAEKLTFTMPATALKAIKISGEEFKEFKADQHEYTLPYAYNPGIVIAGVPATNELFVTDASGYPFLADNAAKTITVKAYNAMQDTVSYVFHFMDEVEGKEAGEYKGALSVALTTPKQAPQAMPLTNSTIYLTKNSTGTVNLAIKNFSFAGLPVGDIFVSNLPVQNNQVEGKRYIRLTSYMEDGTPNAGSMGWMLGVLPIQVKATIYPEGNKVVDASIDILTAESPNLAAMFENIHVDFVTYGVTEENFVQAEGGRGLGYYPHMTLTGRLTKNTAKFIHLNTSYVNSSKMQIDNPMTYIDLTQVQIDRDVTLEDIMTGAPEVRNTLVYVNATSAIYGQNVVKGSEADQIVLADSVNFFAPKAFTAKKVSYDREFTAGNAEALVLPFKVPAEAVNGKLYQLSAVDGDAVNFEQVHTGIVANQPYLVEADAAQLFAEVNDAEFLATPVSAEDMKLTAGAYHHFGTMSALSVQSKDEKTFYELQDGQFVKADKATVVPFRAMLASDAATALEQLNLNLVQVETGIGAVDAASACVDVYSLDGKLVRRQVKAAEAVQGLAEGLYIVGGKKVIVK